MKRVLITGSASGLGLALTQSFFERGWQVLATDINQTELSRLSAERGWPGDRVLLRKLDVTSSADWEALAREIKLMPGSLDVVINNAGHLRPGYIATSDDLELDRHLDINVKGVIRGSRMAARLMQEQGAGHIINIASLAGIAPVPGIALYSTAKFAVRGFSLALAQELRDRNIFVTVVCPDAIKTPMLDLQAQYEEAALTFSGPRSLSVEEVTQVIHQRVLIQRPMEVLLPATRGVLAKLSNLFPGLTLLLAKRLKAKGRKAQLNYRG
jgi:3-oxoacyl-[acyl-carrier protein] reductase